MSELCAQPESKADPAACSVALIAVTDESNRLLCRSVLESEGWSVSEAASGDEVVQHCLLYPPDVIVLGTGSDAEQDFVTTRRLRSSPNTESTPIILLSDHDDSTTLEAVLDIGAELCLSRPLRPQDLAIRIRSMSRMRRAWSELQRGRAMLGEQSRALGLLLDFSAALSRKEDLDSILAKTIEVTAEMTSCRRISIMLPDPSEQSLSIVASLGIDAKVIRNVKLSFGESIAGRVFTTETPIMLNSQEEAMKALDKRDVRVFQGLPMLSTPMCASEHIVGVLNLTGRIAERPFDTSEIDFLNLLTNYAASAIQNVRTREARDQARDSIVIALAKLAEHRDNDTGKHLERVTLFSCRLAEELRRNPVFAREIDSKFIRNLERAAPLHDIGKVAIPDAILLKPGKLSDDEMEIMRTHADIGAETIRSVIARAPDSGFLHTAEEIAQGHHEWFDGTGYPRGLRGNEIPLSARLVALADVYDALTTRRVYKDAFSHRKSVQIILKDSGTHFDPDIVRAFLKLEPEFERLARELADDFPQDGKDAHPSSTAGLVLASQASV